VAHAGPTPAPAADNGQVGRVSPGGDASACPPCRPRPDARPRSRLGARLATVAILGLLAASLAAPAGAAAATDPWTIDQAEQAMVGLLNHDRTAAGLVPVQTEARLMAIARARSVDMATKHYFSHTQPDGRMVFDILNAQHIAWYGAGEIIAWNNYPGLELSTANANSQWMNSPGHKAIVLSTTLNYVGVGLAIDAWTGKKLWTAVYIRAPTGPAPPARRRASRRSPPARPTRRSGSRSAGPARTSGCRS
jgi:uncharacterized protein YkwD